MKRKSKYTTEDMHILASKKNGKCISLKYESTNDRLEWECSRGHTWFTTSDSIKRGHWCQKCYFEKKVKYTIKDMQSIAESRGGKCLSEKYGKRLNWICGNGHTWSATPADVRRGCWCPDCSSFLSERICRVYFEAIFNKKFSKSRPEWLKINSRPMELDGYCKELRIAFEHQGEQHYNENKMFSKNEKSLKDLQNRDELKRTLCSLNNIILIEIPALITRTPIEELENFIFNELSKHKIFPKIERPIVIDSKQYYLPEDNEMWEKIIEKVILKKGKIISKLYRGMKTNYIFECSEGHCWSGSASNLVYGDKWCKDCAMKKLFTKISDKIICINNNKIYASISEAARDLKINTVSISNVLTGKQIKTKGLTFKYYNEGDKNDSSTT